MNLLQILAEIEKIGETNGIKPWIVGGIPRDRILQRDQNFSDIDLATGDQSIHNLAKEVGSAFRGPNTHFLTMSDGHHRIILDGLKIDFSSNFIVPGADFILKNRKLDASPLNQEMISRDFTCNTLLMSLDLQRVSDPLKIAVKDISNKILDSCLDPKITLGSDHKRIPRIIYLCSKLSFQPSSRVIDWVRTHGELIRTVENEYIIKKIKKAIIFNKQKTVEMLDLLNLWSHLPHIAELYSELTPNRI